MKQSTDISVVVPVKNEAGNIESLIKEIDDALQKLNYEIIYVNDGSKDKTADELKLSLIKNKRLRVINHKESQGQSAALRSGVIASKSPIIATLDGDGQNDPSDLSGMIKLFKNNANHLVFVGGVRVNRKDGKHRLWASSVAKYSRLFLLKDTHPDSGCGIKVFHKELFLKLPYFDHMHRFLSALAHREEAKILEYDVKHRERQIGTSNYTNFGRLIVGISDILGVIWLRKRMPKNKVSKEIFK